MQLLQTSYYKLWEELAEQDKEDGVSDPICNEHMSVLDFLTTSDVRCGVAVYGKLWQALGRQD